MEPNAKPYPVVKFRLNQPWNCNRKGDVIEVGPELLDALIRGGRGEVVGEEVRSACCLPDGTAVSPKMVKAVPLNKSLAAQE